MLYLKKHYGEEFVVDQLTNLVASVAKDPNQFGSFNEKGEYIPDAEKLQKLVQKVFEKDVANVNDYLAAFLALFFLIFVCYYGREKITI